MTALHPVVMPKLGLTMTEGVLAEWKVAPGDTVSVGDVIFVVETDKISNEIEAQVSGVVAELHAVEGDVLPVGAPVISFRTDGAPVAVNEQQPLRNVPAIAERSVATPLARRMAANAGIDLAGITGSGPRGRIMADDISAVNGNADDGFTARQDVDTVEEAQPAIRGTVHELGAYQRVAARRLTEAKRDIPHFYVFAEADVTELLALREQLNAGQGLIRLTVNSFITTAVARALLEAPQMNGVWAEGSLRELATIDVGMAIEGPKGLVAPVLRNIGALTLDETAQAADALVKKARVGRLAANDLNGGAIAISNVGMFGATGLLPIINPGQSSILGVGANKPVFHPDTNGQPVLRQILNLALSCDHRVIDGAQAARFLQVLCKHLERPAALLRRPQQEI